MEPISIDKEAERFKKHLNLEENHRIILSGIFGIGKSYFIEEFSKMYQDDYLVFKLDPVNYTVSSNDDIFELIKFDIAYHMMSTGVEFEKFEVDDSKFSQYYLLNNYKGVIKTLLYNLKKIDGRIDAIISSVQELGDNIQKKKEALKIDERKDLKRFIEDYYSESTGIREEDDITVLINSLLETLKEQFPHKKLVLAFDDLDRIDPEHLFRILNVFSAHFDFHEGANKFNFDKVVLICDIENIRGIFHHRYGTNIDFTGYIDKFYSTEIFHYNFREVLMEHVSAFLSKVRTDHSELQESLVSRGNSTYYSVEISQILTDLIRTNMVNTRSIVSLLSQELSLPGFRLDLGNKGYKKLYSTSIPLIVVFMILERLLRDSTGIIHALTRATEAVPFLSLLNYHDSWERERTIGTAVMLIDANNNQFVLNENHEFHDQELDLKIVYKIHYTPKDKGSYGEILCIGGFKADLIIDNDFTSSPKKDFQVELVPYYQLLIKAYQAYLKLKF